MVNLAMNFLNPQIPQKKPEMKKHTSLLITMVCALIAFSIGCAATQTDLVQEGVVSIIRLPENKTHVQSAHVYRTNGDITISGNIKFRSPHRGYHQGNVDITILNPDDSIRVKTTAPTRHRHKRRIDNMPPSYFVRIPVVPSEGSIIQVIYHGGGVKRECTTTQM
jgi:hypothetical protein